MDDLLAFRDLELAYKSFYLETGLMTQDTALDIKEFRRVLEAGGPRYIRLGTETFGECGQFLPDYEYFQEKQDVSVLQHLRYMPALNHCHEFFELAVVLSGSVSHFIGQRKENLHCGDVFILAPRAQHAVCTYRDDTIMVNILIRARIFEQSFMNLLPNDYILRSFFANAIYGSTDMPYVLFSAGDDRHLREYVQNLIMEANNCRRYYDTMLKLILSQLFVHLLREHERDVLIPQLKESSITENILTILNYIEQHYVSITLPEMAAFFNYSERQLSRIIKSATGYSFENLIKHLRMKRAKELLEISDLPVADIATSIGYYDASSFRQAFKKFYHQTPQEFRRDTLSCQF